MKKTEDELELEVLKLEVARLKAQLDFVLGFPPRAGDVFLDECGRRWVFQRCAGEGLGDWACACWVFGLESEPSYPLTCVEGAFAHRGGMLRLVERGGFVVRLP